MYIASPVEEEVHKVVCSALEESPFITISYCTLRVHVIHMYTVVHFATDEVPPDVNPVPGFVLHVVANAAM